MSRFARQFSMTIALTLALVYLVYRALFTLNLDSPYAIFVSISLFIAEIYGVFMMALYFHQVWDTSEPEEVEAVPGYTVDVLIPTYNEGADILRATIRAARDMEYPHKTYVLDDSRRPEIEELAKELNVGYFSRENNLHAKAGNLNNALEQTDGEFIIIFDADHIAKPSFITRTIGYFSDPKLGFVQTPHAFYNFDSYPARVNFKKKTYWEEGQLFYNVIQAGKNHWNSVIFCGSAAIFRREALESVGLIATETITEDMHTGLRMHAKGWKSFFVNERLIAGQAAPDITTSQSQRLRWGEGNLSIFAYDNPITIKGLTLAQRLSYVGSMLSWTTGIARLVFYTSPILMLLTGVAPVTNFSWVLGALMAIYLLSTWTAIKIIGDGYGNLWNAEVAAMSDFFTQCRCTYRAFLRRGRQKFVVTSKSGRQSSNLISSLMPQITIATLGICAIGLAAARCMLGVSDDWLGLSIGGVLILFEIALALEVIRHAMRPAPSQVSTRHPTNGVHVHYSYQTSKGQLVKGQAITNDISEETIGMIAYREIPEGTKVSLLLDGVGREVQCHGVIATPKKIISTQLGRDSNLKAYSYDICLDYSDMSAAELGEVENQILELGMNYAVQRWYQRFGHEYVPALLDQKIMADSIGSNCLVARLPVELTFNQQKTAEKISVVTEQVSELEMKVFMVNPLEIGNTCQFEMESPAGTIRGMAEIISVKSRRLAQETIYLHHYRFTKFDDQGRGLLQLLMANSRLRRVKAAIAPTPKSLKKPLWKPVMTVAAPTLAASLALYLTFIPLHRDDWTIAKVIRSGEATEEDAILLEEIYQKAIVNGLEDPNKLQKIQVAMRAIDREGSQADMVKQLLRYDPNNHELRFAQAASKESEGLELEAYDELMVVLKESDQSKDASEEFTQRMLIQVARNAANRGDTQAAASHFRRLVNDFDAGIDLEREYAGLLIQENQLVESRRILEQHKLDIESTLLLSSIDTIGGDFAASEELLDDLLISYPKDRRVREAMGDVLVWQERYQEGIDFYRGLLLDFPEDSQLFVKIARTHVWMRNYPLAMQYFDRIEVAILDDSQLQRDFLFAAAGIDNLAPDQLRLIKTIYSRDSVLNDEAAKQAYYDVFVKHLRNDKLVPLLEDKLARNPNAVMARRQLADLLQSLGRHAEAEPHYRILLNQTSVKPVQSTSVGPKLVRPVQYINPLQYVSGEEI